MNESLAAIFQGPDQDLELRSIPFGPPQGGEILVRVLGCTLCGSDVHTFSGRRTTPLPTILGHEIVGVIESMGDAAPTVDMAGEGLAIGDRITWSIVASCGKCFYCERGLPQKCQHMWKYGHEAMRPGHELSGGLAEHCVIAPGTAIMRLPEALPLAIACPANCATGTIAAAIAAAGDIQDRHICVFGAGMLGLTACAMLKSRGAAHVVCVDIDAQRAKRAEDFGADAGITPDAFSWEGEGFDAVLEISGASSAFEAGLQSLRLGGTIVLVGTVFPAPPVPIELERLTRRNIRIHGIHNYTPEDLRTAVTFLAENYERYPFADLVHQWYPLEEANTAFAKSKDPAVIRVGVCPSA